VVDIAPYIEAHRDRFLRELFALVAQPSISARGEGLAECATLLHGMMEEAGIRARILPTRTAPAVYGEVGADPVAPTVLVYGHYDVQPPEPLDAWDSPPFVPTLRNGRIYGRGTGDNKGQHLAHIKAIEVMLQTRGRVPVNIKLLIDGEEEIGSPSLADLVVEHRDLLRADLMYAADGPMHESGRPLVFLGLRGVLYLELTARGANRDVHSGQSDLIPNAAWRLVRALHSMKDADDRILIEGFYEDVLPPTPVERDLLASVPLDEVAWCRELGLRGLGGQKGLRPQERLMFSPSMNISGLESGYTQPGAMTVIPSKATAKLDIYLVKNQRPEAILEKVRAHLRHHGWGDIEMKVLFSFPPSKTPPDHPLVQVVLRGVEQAFGERPIVYPTLGGYAANYVFTDLLGIPAVWVPYAQPDENNHAPNENLRVDHFFRGIQATVRVLDELGRRERS
jgi:acetylornithine deacetylase/succinyl-diaminopimelate desuccinylase-like protein